MRRSRGFTLQEALISILILSMVMIVALTLLLSMRSFASKQQAFTAPRQAARSAVDYLSFFVAGATDLNIAQGNPNALVMWTTFGNAATSAANLRQASYNNLTAAQGMGTGTLGYGDVGTDIISLSTAVNPTRIPIISWTGNAAGGTTAEINFTVGCPNDANNLTAFKRATGATMVGLTEVSGLLTVQDTQGRWRYVQITNYKPSTCSAESTTLEVIHVDILPGTSDQVNPPGGWRGDLVAPLTLNAGLDFTSFRVRNGSLEQKVTGFDPSGVLSPGIFDPACDGRSPAPGCPTIGFTPVIENVEDLQVAYVYQDGTVWNTGTQVLTTTGAVPEQVRTLNPPGARDIAFVRAVRVSVTARSNALDIEARSLAARPSATPSAGTTSRRVGLYRRPALEDHAEGALDTLAGGVFDRHRLTTTLLLRNRLLGF